MIETALIDRLSPLVEGRVYFGVAPEGAALPRLILQTVSEGAGFTLTGCVTGGIFITMPASEVMRE